MTGVLPWFVMPRVFDVSYSAFLVLSIVLATVFFAVAIARPDRASSWLGKTWDAIVLLNREILNWIKLIK
jgi:hypothetical protein